MTATVADLHAQMLAELTNWDREYQLDTTIDGCRITIADDGFNVHIEHISVPDDNRRAGRGSAILSAATAWADQQGETLRLHMSTEYGTPADVLAEFYGRHGFERVNKGGDMLRPCRNA